MPAFALNLLNSFLAEAKYPVIKHPREFSLASARLGLQVGADCTDFTAASRRAGGT